MCGNVSVGHDIGKKQQSVIIFARADDFSPNHLHPLVENLLEIVGSDLRAHDFSRTNRSFNRFDELRLVRFNSKGYEVRPDVLRNLVKRFRSNFTRRLTPFNDFSFE